MGEILTGAASAIQNAVGATGASRNGAPSPPPQSYMVDPNVAPPLPSPYLGVPGDVSGGVAPETVQGGLPPMAAALLGQSETPVPEEAPEPYNNPYTPMDPEGPPLSTDEPQGEDISVEGDTWQPKKLSPLEQVADFFLKGNLRYRNKQANLRSAMEGYDRDPEKVFSRIRRHIDPKLAQEFEQRYSATQANRELAQNRRVDYINKGGDDIAAMLDVIEKSNNPEQAYTSLRPVLNNFAKMYNHPELPETFNKDELAAWRKRGLSVAQQETLDRLESSQAFSQNLRTQQREDMVQHRAAQREALERHRAHAREIAEKKLEAKPEKNGARTIKNDNGSFVTISPDGTRAAMWDANEKRWFAYRLGRKGDFKSRVRSPAEDAKLAEKYGSLDADK